MSLFIKLIVLIGILACIGPFFINDPNGQPLLTIDDLSAPDFSSFENVFDEAEQFISSNISLNNSDEVQVYKWTDTKGVVHYSNNQNNASEGRLIQLKEISILPLEEGLTVTEDGSKSLSPSSLPTPTLTSIPIQQIPELIKDAKNIQNLLDTRKDKMDRVIDSN